MRKYRGVILHKDSYRTTKWSGGFTTELAIAPENSLYKDRNFLWRVSSASVETGESMFTSLPDYNRIILTLKGEIRLSHNGGKWISLSEYEPHFFDGGDETRSVGRVTDFNLMMRKGKCIGEVKVLEPGTFPQKASRDLKELFGGQKPSEIVFLYCAQGEIQIGLRENEEKKIELQEGDSLMFEYIKKSEQTDSIKISYQEPFQSSEAVTKIEDIDIMAESEPEWAGRGILVAASVRISQEQ